VVESSLGVPTGCAGKLRWQTAGIFGEAVMAEPWDGVGKAAMAEPIRHKRGASGWVRYKLDETIEKSCSDLLAIHQRQCIFGKIEIF
jgi:hypothetical protein